MTNYNIKYIIIIIFLLTLIFADKTSEDIQKDINNRNIDLKNINNEIKLV